MRGPGGEGGGLSEARLRRLHDVLAWYVETGRMPGLVALVSRRGRTHVDAIGTLSLGGSAPMHRDTIFRIASMTKPITAVALLLLVEECRVRLDDPVDRWLPELADRRVLRTIESQLDDTVPAERAITVRDLATFTFGFGNVLAPPGTYPIQAAVQEVGVRVRRPRETDPDEWLRRFATLPLMYQPGERWLYDTGADILGILIARVTGRSFGDFLRDRVLEPLGMRDTGFHVPVDRIDRLATGYGHDQETGELVVDDEAVGGQWSAPPSFESGGGGLVSTVDDLLAFHRMLLNGGRHDGERLLSRPSVELMTTDLLTPGQKVGAEGFLGDHGGWGIGTSVRTRRTDLAAVGQFGWVGGLGTSAYADPVEDLVGVLLTQKAMDSPEPPTFFTDFWTAAYAAIDD